MTPDPVAGNPPVVAAQIQAPAPENEAQFGEAIWVKVFTTEFEDPIGLEELVGDNAKVQQAETEIEWQLLQTDPGNPLAGQLESGYGAPVGPNAERVGRSSRSAAGQADVACARGRQRASCQQADSGKAARGGACTVRGQIDVSVRSGDLPDRRDTCQNDVPERRDRQV